MTTAAQGRLPFDPITEAMRHWRAHGWDDAATGMGVVTSVIRAEQILAGRAEEAVRPFGLTFARYEVLMLSGSRRAASCPWARSASGSRSAPGA